MPLSDNLAAYYKLDEASGVRNDSVGANALAVTGSVTQNTGKLAGAAEFVASAYLSCADAAAFSFTNAMSVQYWVYETNQSGGDQGHINKWNYSSDGGWGIQCDPATPTAIKVYLATSPTDNGNGCAGSFLDAGIPLNTWAHVVLVFDGTQTGNANRLKLYVNGVAKTYTSSSGAVPAALQNDTALLCIGGWPSLNRWFAGRIDEVGLWGRPLTSAEVTQLYNGGAGMSYSQIIGGGSAPTTVTDFVDVPAAQAAGYVLVETLVNYQMEPLNVAKLTKWINPPLAPPDEFGASGTGATAAAARAQALAGLNATRRLRYTGSPNGTAIVPNAHGDALVLDQT